MRADEQYARQTDRGESLRCEAPIELGGLGCFGWHARKVCSDRRLRQGWIVVIECQACTDSLISEKGQLDFNATLGPAGSLRWQTRN